MDILLDRSGDIDVTALGDIRVENSIRQAILIHLRWIHAEWRLGPEMGFKWFEEVFVKNPNTQTIRQLVREEILKVEGVKSAFVVSVEYDRAKRTAKFRYTASTDEETFREEVILYG